MIACRRASSAHRRTPSDARSAARNRASRSRSPCLRANRRPRVLVSPRPLRERLLDRIEALIESVAAELDVAGFFQIDSMRSPGRITFLRRISKGSIPSSLRKLVHRRLDGERRLRRAVTAESAAGHHVGVDGVRRRLSCWRSGRGSAVRRARRRASRRRGCRRRRCWRRRALAIAVSVPSRFAPSLTCVFIGWRVVALVNCSVRVHSHITGRPVFSVDEHAQILADHLLLAAESAADALGKDVDVARKQIEEVAELLFGDERRLRTGAHVKPAVVARSTRSRHAFPDGRSARRGSSRSSHGRRRLLRSPAATLPTSP